MVKDYYNYMFDDFENIKLDFNTIINIDNELLYKILQTYVILFEENINKQYQPFGLCI